VGEALNVALGHLGEQNQIWTVGDWAAVRREHGHASTRWGGPIRALDRPVESFETAPALVERVDAKGRTGFVHLTDFDSPTECGQAVDEVTKYLGGCDALGHWRPRSNVGPTWQLK
jgi:hypothetical protein